VARLNGELLKVMQLPEVRERLSVVGALPTTSTPEAFGRFIDSEIARWATVVKASGAKVE
jgi:tripartite-type tricarboxylate transporter receptor subunit TctC